MHPARWVGLRQALLTALTHDGAHIQKASDLPTPLHDPNRPQAALGSPDFLPRALWECLRTMMVQGGQDMKHLRGQGEILFPQ